MATSWIRVALLVAMVFVASACATTQAPPATPLRVGVTPTYPPIVFKIGNQVAGVEPDLAVRLAQALGRRVEFVELRWDDQIPALLAGKTDIIMSGMSVTQARQVRIAFAEPYLQSGLTAAFRADDAARYGERDRLLNASVSVGAIEGTTGDAFVQRNFPNAQRVHFSQASDGALGLRRRTIDIFVHDAPSIAWLVSENEAELAGFRELLNRESLAWGVRRDDAQLLNRTNEVLGAWKAGGTLNAVLKRWLPYWRFPE